MCMAHAAWARIRYGHICKSRTWTPNRSSFGHAFWAQTSYSQGPPNSVRNCSQCSTISKKRTVRPSHCSNTSPGSLFALFVILEKNVVRCSHCSLRTRLFGGPWRFSNNYWTRVFILWTLIQGCYNIFYRSPSKSHQHKLCYITLISSFHSDLGDFPFSRENIFSLQKGDLLGRISLPFFKGRFWREKIFSPLAREILKGESPFHFFKGDF